MAAYNCCITIRNSLDQPLTILNNWDLEPDDGSWQSPPPGTISPNQESTFQLEEIVAAPPLGTGASVCYRVILPDCDGVEWLILVNFTSRQGRNTFYTSSAFAFDEGQGRRSISCDFFALEETILPANGQALEARLNVKYNNTLTTKSHVTRVTIPNGFIEPHIRNTKKELNSLLVDGDSDFIIWNADSIAEYEDNSDSFVSGSNFPVAVDINDKDLQMLCLHIVIAEEQLLGVPLEIYGDSDVEQEVIGLPRTEQRPGRVCFRRTGELEVPLMVAPSWARTDFPWGVVGNIVWRFRSAETGRLLGLNSSRLEFYALSPKLPSFFSGAVPVTLARRFVLPQKKEPADLSWERYCCSAAFYNFSFQYEVEHGAPSYVDDDAFKKGHVVFRLQAYLSDIGKGGRPLNCYDQASIMLVCLALLPAASSVEYIFMDPFGLIKATALVGRGVCNNPFYNNSLYQNEKVCDDGSQTRSGFENHAFVRLMKVGDTDGKIVDACTGPHLGNETLEQFINSSIDKRQGSRFGTQDNARPMDSFSLI